MYFNLLSKRDLSAIDALIASYGGPKAVSERSRDIRGYKKRREIAPARVMETCSRRRKSTLGASRR